MYMNLQNGYQHKWSTYIAEICNLTKQQTDYNWFYTAFDGHCNLLAHYLILIEGY